MPMAARAQVPAGIGRQGGGDHRRAHAGDLVAVCVHRGNQHGVIGARDHRRRLAIENAACSVWPVVEQRQTARRARHGHAGDCRKLAAPGLRRHQRASFMGRHAAWRRRLAAARPAIERIQRGAEQRGGGDDVGEVLADAARRRPHVRVRRVLRAGPEIDARRRRDRQVRAARVGVHQRAAALPVFGGGLCVQYQWIGVRALEDGVRLTGQMVGGRAIGEGKDIGVFEMILVLLARRHRQIGEARGVQAAGAGDMGEQAVEHAAALGVGVEAVVDIVANGAPGLRAAPAIGFFNRSQQGVSGFRVAQKRDEIAHRGMAEAEHQRGGAGVDQFVDPAGGEAAVDVEMRARGHQSGVGALHVQTDAAFEAGEAPIRARHDLARRMGVLPACQRRLLSRHHFVAARRCPAGQRQNCHPLAPDIFDAHDALHGAPALHRHRQVEQHPPIARQQVALPGAPDHRIAAAQEKAVAGMRGGLRIVAGARVVEIDQCPLVAAVAPVEENSAIAARGIDRAEDCDVAGEGDQAIGPAQCEIDVGDRALTGRRGIDGVVRAGADHFIGPGRTECRAAGKGHAADDLEFHGSSLRQGAMMNRAAAK